MEQLSFIPASKVKELLDPKKLVDVIEDALIKFSKRQGVQQPVRSVVSVPKHNGYAKYQCLSVPLFLSLFIHSFFGVMPAYVEVGNCLGAKLVSFYSGNVDKNIPSHHAVIVLLEPSTGVPLVVSNSGIYCGSCTHTS